MEYINDLPEFEDVKEGDYEEPKNVGLTAVMMILAIIAFSALVVVASHTQIV